MAYLYVLRITGVGRVWKRNWKKPFRIWVVGSVELSCASGAEVS